MTVRLLVKNAHPKIHWVPQWSPQKEPAPPIITTLLISLKMKDIRDKRHSNYQFLAFSWSFIELTINKSYIFSLNSYLSNKYIKPLSVRLNYPGNEFNPLLGGDKGVGYFNNNYCKTITS